MTSSSERPNGLYGIEYPCTCCVLMLSISKPQTNLIYLDYLIGRLDLSRFSIFIYFLLYIYYTIFFYKNQIFDFLAQTVGNRTHHTEFWRLHRQPWYMCLHVGPLGQNRTATNRITICRPTTRLLRVYYPEVKPLD